MRGKLERKFYYCFCCYYCCYYYYYCCYYYLQLKKKTHKEEAMLPLKKLIAKGRNSDSKHFSTWLKPPIHKSDFS